MKRHEGGEGSLSALCRRTVEPIVEPIVTNIGAAVDVVLGALGAAARWALCTFSLACIVVATVAIFVADVVPTRSAPERPRRSPERPPERPHGG